MADTHSTTDTPVKAKRRLRPVRWLLASVGVVLALLVLTAVVITHWDWNSARPWVAQKVSDATGRSFSIDGDLTAQWHWPQPLESSWRRWIPGVTIQAQQLQLGNPEGFRIVDEPARTDDHTLSVPAKATPASQAKLASLAQGAARLAAQTASAASAQVTAASQPEDASSTEPPTSDEADKRDAERLLQREDGKTQREAPPRTPQTLGTIASASASLRLLPLLSRTIALDTVVLDSPDIALGRTKDGHNNWTFEGKTQNEDGAPWSLRLGQLIIQNGSLAYADAIKDLALRARIDTLSEESLAKAKADAEAKNTDFPYGIHVMLHGRYAKARIEAEALGGPVLSLRKRTVNYPLHVKARAGSLRAEAQGILANPVSLSGMDLQVSLSGASMADLYALTGLVLPSTPAFKTQGRLVGDLTPEQAVWEYRDFDGSVGASDLHGSLKYTSAKPRPKLEGLMVSKKLRLVDLGPLVGNSSSQEAALKTKGKVLPEARFDTARWNAMDLDLAFSGEQIIRPASLPIDNLSTRAVLEDGQLQLSPLRFGVAKGKITADVTLDSREKPLKVRLHGTANTLQLAALFPEVELMKKSFGQLDGAVSLVAHGDSIATMLASANGESKLFVRDGTFSKQMLDMAALNVGSIIVSKLFGDNKEVKLRCAVADFAVRDGLATARTARLATDEATVDVTGTVNLKDEILDFSIKPESLKWKFFSLRTPLYVRGSFAKPDVGLEKGPLLLRAGAAVIAAVAAPVALALVPVTVPAAQDDVNCKAMLAQVDAPPGKAALKKSKR